MVLYNTTILVAGIQFLVLLNDGVRIGSKTYTLSAVNDTVTIPQYYGLPYGNTNYYGALVYDDRDITFNDASKPYILQAIVNNSLVGNFAKGICDGYSNLVLANPNTGHIITLPYVVMNGAGWNGPMSCLFIRSIIAELKQLEYTAHITNLQNKIDELEKRTNYVENNRAWW